MINQRQLDGLIEKIAKEEIFGPLVGIQSACDAEHALELANSSDDGLSSAVLTGDIACGVQFAQRLSSGMTGINDMPVDHATDQLWTTLRAVFHGLVFSAR